MPKQCTLQTDVYSVTFTFYSVTTRKPQGSVGGAEYEIEFRLHQSLGDVAFSTHRTDYLLMDLTVFVDYIDKHVSHLLKFGKVDETPYIFTPYKLRFQARAGESYLRDTETGQIEDVFDLLFLVNIAPQWPSQNVFLGGNGTVNIRDAQEFVQAMRTITASDF